MKRILSGSKSSGNATLGNYLGAIQRWVKQQNEGGDEYFFFVPNLHALTSRPDPAALRRDTLSNVAWLLASGLDPSKVTIFVQSQVPAHAELAWIFNNYVTMGELGRMTQYKDKVLKSSAEGQLVGIFTYPALMAADILLYDTNEVPVGEDQRQHVELTRDIAERFNNKYGATFVVPTATVAEMGARIMNLQDPSAKMSKSDDDHSGNVMMADTSDVMTQKFMRAVTGSGSGYSGEDAAPGVKNLVEIFAAITGTSAAGIIQKYSGVGYGQFKKELSEEVITHVEPIQRRHGELLADSVKLQGILSDGREKAAAIADLKLNQVKETLGLL